MFRHAFRTLASTTALLLASTNPALAGTSVMAHFVNMSPYAARIDFPKGMQDCWDDTGAEFDRSSWWDRQLSSIARYEQAYRENFASHKSYMPYMQLFKSSMAIADYANVPTTSMDGTSATLGPGKAGQPVAQALFRGATSASILGNCKFNKSSRGFRITLLDGNKEVLRQHYEITDPPDSAWRLTRISADMSRTEQVEILGTGGQGRPWEIGLATASAVITVASLGSAAGEMMAARAGLRALVQQGMARMAGTGGASMAEKMMMFSLQYRVTKVVEGEMVKFVRVSLGQSIAAKVMYTFLADGILYFARPTPHSSTSDAFTRIEHTELMHNQAAFDPPSLIASGSLPTDTDKRNICLIESDAIQLGVRICDVVGISLSILPNGTLVFAPLPSVGDGYAPP